MADTEAGVRIDALYQGFEVVGKLGALDRKTGYPKEAEAHYASAIRLLPGRPETASVFLFLGTAALAKRDFAKAAENLQRAQNLDVSLAGPVQMWTALMHEREDQPEMAEAAYKNALAADNADSARTFETLTLYGRFLSEHGRESEAAAIKVRAAAIHSTRPHPQATAKDESGAPSAYRVGGDVSQPSVIYKVDPPYSEEARVAKYSATVLLQLIVGTDAVAHRITVVKPTGFGLDDCAVSTVAKWKFKPEQKNGNPVPVYATVEVNFRLL
jgi:TonB family protein